MTLLVLGHKIHKKWRMKQKHFIYNSDNKVQTVTQLQLWRFYKNGFWCFKIS